MKKMKKAVILVTLLLMMVLFLGCTETNKVQSQSEGTKEEILYEKDYPLPPGKTEKDVLELLRGGNTYYSDNPIFESIIQRSDVIVLAKVVEREESYISSTSAFVATGYQIEVEKAFKGDVEEKAKLSISTDGGFLSAKKFVEQTKEDTKRKRQLAELPEADKEKLVGYFAGEYRTIQLGQSYVFFLGPVRYHQDLFKGDYQVLYGGYGIYVYDAEKQKIHNSMNGDTWFDLKDLNAQ